MRTVWSPLLMLCLTACPPDAADTASEAGFVALEAPQVLRRASLDLRGVLPSVEELDDVEADPGALDGLLADYLDDERFADRYTLLLAERWHTRLDEFQIPYVDYFLDADEDYQYNRSVGEEPLRLMSHVVANDLPWTDVVTADYTVADDLLISIWDLDAEAGSGWREARYGDGRPAAGVLSTNGLWWRYVTNLGNKNRSRAAAISRLLLCEDYLSRPISVTADATSGDAADAAVQTVPGCMSCHSSLDPMAAVLFGFTNTIQYNPPEMDTYHPEREVLGAEWLDVEPAYFGTPIDGLHDLGVNIAGDPRFVRCTAQSNAELLLRREATPDDHDTITALSEVLVDNELVVAPMLTEVLSSEEYRAAEVDPGHARADEFVTTRMMTPDQLATVLEDTLGFTWRWDGYAILDSDSTGLRVLAGGVDGDMITSAQLEPGLTWTLVVERTAEYAAVDVVERELVGTSERRFFPADLTLDTPSDDPVFQDTLAALCWQLYGERPDDDQLTGLTQLFDAVDASAGPTEAWKAVVAALLRDPALVVY